MSRLYRLLSILCLLIIVISCEQTTDVSPPEVTKLFGTVATFQDSLITLHSSEEQSSLILKNGRFTWDFSIHEPMYASLIYAGREYPIYLEPGFQLAVTLDTTNRLSVSYEGRGSEANNFLAAYQHFEEVNKPNFDALWDSEELVFRQEIRRYRSKEEAFIRNYQRKNHNLDPEFITREKSRVLYRWGNRLWTYYAQPNIMATKGLPREEEFDFQDELNLNEDELLHTPEYRTYIKNEIVEKARLMSKGRFAEQSQLTFSHISETIDNQDVKDFALLLIMEEILSSDEAERHAFWMDKFLVECQNGEIIAKVQSLYDQWDRLQRGRKAPLFKMESPDDNFLRLRDYRGDLVYIYVWSTACHNFLSELEKISELSSQMDLESVTWICINADVDAHRWKSTVADENGNVIHMRPDEGADAPFFEDYGIDSLPHSVLLDRQGHFIYSQAPFPRDTQLLQVLTQLLSHTGVP